LTPGGTASHSTTPAPATSPASTSPSPHNPTFGQQDLRGVTAGERSTPMSSSQLDDLLRRTRLSVRFGKLNHCTLDDANPIGAKCLEDAVIPEGHQGPLIDRCQPSRCANSVIAPAHLPIWTAERASLTDLLATPKLPPNRRALLTSQLHEVDLVIRKAGR
ncbi:hypothetical protein ABZV80_45850, partial [Streptomyces sp. NPDC005132]